MCLHFNKSALNWTFSQLLHWKLEPLDCPAVCSVPATRLCHSPLKSCVQRENPISLKIVLVSTYSFRNLPQGPLQWSSGFRVGQAPLHYTASLSFMAPMQLSTTGAEMWRPNSTLWAGSQRSTCFTSTTLLVQVILQKLRFDQISYSVCPQKAYQALFNVCEWGQEQTQEWRT